MSCMGLSWGLRVIGLLGRGRLGPRSPREAAKTVRRTVEWADEKEEKGGRRGALSLCCCGSLLALGSGV